MNFSGVKTIYRVYPALLNTQLLDNTDICHNGKVLRFPNTMIAGISYGFIVSDKR